MRVGQIVSVGGGAAGPDGHVIAVGVWPVPFFRHVAPEAGRFSDDDPVDNAGRHGMDRGACAASPVDALVPDDRVRFGVPILIGVPGIFKQL